MQYTNVVKKAFYLLAGSLGILSMVIFFDIHPVFAAIQTYDCNITVNAKDTISWANGLYQTNGPLDKPALEIVFSHLSNYCKRIVGGAESPLLFDHLLDIGFRRLDAYEDETLRYGLTSDEKGKERQNKIKEFTDTKKITTPETIINTFVEYRGDNPQKNPEPPLSTTCEVKNYNTLNLYKRYIATCEIARCISLEKTKTVSEDITKTSAGLVQTYLCSTIALQRRNKEVAFIRQLTARASLSATDSLFTSYNNTYFTSRWSDLYESFTAFDQGLTFINRKIQEGTATCSK